MDFIEGSNLNTSVNLSASPKAIALELSLQQCLDHLKELLMEYQQLHKTLDKYKTQYLELKEQCESKKCSCAEEFKKTVASKDNIIQLTVSMLIQYVEKKNTNVLRDIFETLCGNIPENIEKNIQSDYENINPKIEMFDSPIYENNDDSLSEIEGTPTGRTSPIIPTRSNKTGKSSNSLEKKKCSDSWPTPEKKCLKLSFPTPTRSKNNGKLRQSRLNLVKLKQTSVVDLTCSPELASALKRSQTECVQALVKKESVENNDTILPSPTNGPTGLTFFKSSLKESPGKFKKPPLSLKIKKEKSPKSNLENVSKDLEKEDINILNDLPNSFRVKLEQSPIKMKSPIKKKQSIDEDITYCETNSSISLLDHINKLEELHQKQQLSPTKRPLEENMNVVNLPAEMDIDSSLSVLRPTTTNIAADKVKRKLPEEPVYKEPTVRKKAEKQALPGWSCDECKNFFGEIYKDDPVMLARKIDECSKHRGRFNPTRPRTPPHYWDCRWTVPTDTEELNRLNGT